MFNGNHGPVMDCNQDIKGNKIVLNCAGSAKNPQNLIKN